MSYPASSALVLKRVWSLDSADKFRDARGRMMFEWDCGGEGLG